MYMHESDLAGFIMIIMEEEEEGLETVIHVHFVWKIAVGYVSWFICVPLQCALIELNT